MSIGTIDINEKDLAKICAQIIQLTERQNLVSDFIATLLDDADAATARATLGAGTSSAIAATQAEEETGTSTTAYTSPGRQQFHVSAAKGWVIFNGSGTLAVLASYNVSSVTDNGTGDYTVNWTTAFSSANYGIALGGGSAGSGTGLFSFIGGLPTASAVRILGTDAATALADVTRVSVTAFGDQ